MNKHEQRAREWLKANCFAPVLSMCVKSLAEQFETIDTEARQQQKEADARGCARRATILMQKGLHSEAHELMEQAAAIREGGR